MSLHLQLVSPCMNTPEACETMGSSHVLDVKRRVPLRHHQHPSPLAFAGIVEGLDLGHNAMAALVAQGCAEIRWLAEKMGAKPATVSGLSGLGDIMLTCYGSLSRNR